jgi:hypothetical protein
MRLNTFMLEYKGLIAYTRVWSMIDDFDVDSLLE